MGLLDVVGLRRKAPVQFAAWLGAMLDQTWPSNGLGKTWDETQSLLLQLDDRITAFEEKHGRAAFQKAVEHLLARTDGMVVESNLRVLGNSIQMDVFVLPLLQGHRGYKAAGIIRLREVFQELGHLSPSRPPPLQGSADDVESRLVAVVRSFEERLGAVDNAAKLTGRTPDAVWWEMVLIRLNAMHAASDLLQTADKVSRDALLRKVHERLTTGGDGRKLATLDALDRGIAAYGDHPVSKAPGDEDELAIVCSAAGVVLGARLGSNADEILEVGAAFWGDAYLECAAVLR